MTASNQPPTRLGRGLDAIFGARQAVPTANDSGVKPIPIGQIKPNPLQPRKEFRPEDLADLEASLRANGLIQPISVRPAPSGEGFELIAGERRLRAAQRVGWTEIPALIRVVDDQNLLSLALVENLQRSDLNPIEEAEGYDRLMREFDLTQQAVADAVGKDRSTVANIHRLLTLPASVRRLVWEGAISLGHARALLSLGDESQMAAMAKSIVAEGLSVRDVERRTREHKGISLKNKVAKSAPGAGAEARQIEESLMRRLQTNARLVLTGTGKGELRIAFYSADDLERLLDLIVGPNRDV
jgi:ParB family chromosome partitioning protein